MISMIETLASDAAMVAFFSLNTPIRGSTGSGKHKFSLNCVEFQ